MATELTNSFRMLIGPSNVDISTGAVGNTSNKIRANDPVIWDHPNTRLDLFDAAADDANFVGMALGTYDPDVSKPVTSISYARKCVVRGTAASAAAHPVGTGVSINANGAFAVGAGNTVGWLHKASAAADTEWDVLIDTAKLEKQIGVVSA